MNAVTEIICSVNSLQFLENPTECQCQQCLFKRGPRCTCGIVCYFYLLMLFALVFKVVANKDIVFASQEV